MAKKPKKSATKRTKRTPKRRTAPDWGPTFLNHLSRTANIRDSAIAAGVARTTVYQRRDNDTAFASQMASALDDAVDALELEARRRACDGLVRVKFHQGQPIMVPIPGPDGQPMTNEDGEVILVPYVEREYSDTLMIFLLKAHRPEKYRDRHQVEHTGNVVIEVAETVVRTRTEASAALAAVAEAGRVP